MHASAVAHAVVEVRDVSYADARAPVIASVTLPNAVVRPNGRIPFELTAPEPDAGPTFAGVPHRPPAAEPSPPVTYCRRRAFRCPPG